MTSHNGHRNVWTTAAALLLTTAAGLLPACGKKQEQASAPPAQQEQPQQRPTPPPPPPATFAQAPAQPAVQVKEVPEGVEFPEERMPRDPELANAVIDLAQATLTGDTQALLGLLTLDAKVAAEAMQRRGLLQGALQGVQRVRVCGLSEGAEEATVGLGAQRPGAATLLTFRAVKIADEGWRFEGMTPRATAAALQVEEFDGVQLADAPLPEPLPDITLPQDDQEQPRRRSSSGSRSSRGLGGGL